MNIPCKFRPLGNGGLPPGYMWVDFLENTGAQWIDTGLLFATGNIKTRTSSITHTTRNTVTGLLPYEYFGENDVDKGKLFAAYQETATIFTVDVIGISSRYFNNNVPNVANVCIDTENGFVELNGTRRSCTPITFEQTAVTLPIFAKKVWYKKTDLRVQPAKTGVRIHSFEVEAKANGNVQYGNFIPALDPTGTPCMFDTVSKQAFKNDGSGQFIAGIKNASQLRTVLRELPALTGQDMGTLTLSIPAEANTPEMQELLDSTEVHKNWELTIQERAAEVATYSLRRVRKVVWVRKLSAENGSYVDASGLRWQTEWCSAIYSPRGNDPTLHGYEPFDSVEQAVEAWGLMPYEELELEQEEL